MEKDDFNEAVARMVEAARQTASGFLSLLHAYVDAVRAVLAGVDWSALSQAMRELAAVQAAPPRVRHLATHSKKGRVQKKNLKRAMREYERSLRNGKG